jgi:hypothetical protein
MLKLLIGAVCLVTFCTMLWLTEDVLRAGRQHCIWMWL